jgi:arylformamidase
VPLDARLATYPNNTRFTLEPIRRLSRGDSSNASTLHMSAHLGIVVIEGLNLRDVEPGLYEMASLALHIVGSDGAPVRVASSRA